MENTTYRVNVTSPGLTVFFRNRVNRTPVLFSNVYKNELQILELQLKQKSIQYVVEQNIPNEDTQDEITFDEVLPVSDEVKVEELYLKEDEEPESILDKLIAEDE